VVRSMESKVMIEVEGGLFRLSDSIRLDVQRSYNPDQMDMLDLFGAA
jgi:hypothetical protein